MSLSKKENKDENINKSEALKIKLFRKLRIYLYQYSKNQVIIVCNKNLEIIIFEIDIMTFC